jgi:hypothetical protein
MTVKRILFILLISILSLSAQLFAQGDLLISPIRVVFEGTRQKEGLSLVNTGKDTATYSISFLQYTMKEDGSFVSVEKPDSGQMFADPYLRIFPRQVTLAPGEPQVVMLQCRRKTGMPAGEYRSHLYFRAEKNNKPLGMRNPVKDTTLLSVQLIPVYGLSIPIIIRSGEVHVRAAVSDLKLETGQDAAKILKLTIHRTGNISVYGNLTIHYFTEQGNSTEIGKVKGVGVYTNINKRNITIPLNLSPGMILKNGKLKVSYTSPDDTKKVVYAEGELAI